MKKIVNILLGVVALLASASCERSLEFKEDVSEQALTLNFTTGNMATRTVLGVDNENLIKRIDYFFFPYGSDGKVDPSTEYVYKGSVVPEEGHLYDLTYKETLRPAILNQIFPDGNNKAVVMAIANYIGKYGATATEPETTIPEDAKTWEDLHALEVGQTFFKDGGAGFGLRWPRKLNTDAEELFFVMAADSVEVELNKTGKYAIDAIVPLKRLASKVTVQFTFQECTDDKGIKWVPQYQEDQPAAKEARVYLSNAIEHTTIGGPLTRDLVADSGKTATQPAGDGSRDIFEYAYDFLLEIPTTNVEVVGENNETTTVQKKIAHYYTYPVSMLEGDDNQPYLKLVLPWYGYVNRAPEGQEAQWVKAKQKEVYYKIVLPRETISDPNMIYQYDVTVNIIGNEKEVMITGEEYRVKDWSSDDVIENNVGLGRYISLDIPKDTYDMYGDKVQILYVSSGEVEISALQIYDMNLTGNNAVRRYYIDGGPTSYVNPYNANTGDARTPNPNRLPNWVTIQGDQLVVDHTLNTDINSNQVNISPFKFVVTLHLKGETGTQFDRTVTITQYPPIYAETIFTQNSNTVFLNGTQYSTTQTTVNNNANESLGTIGENNGSTARTKTVVSVTTLAGLDITRYNQLGIGAPVIGDPRVTLSPAYPVNPAVPSQTWERQDLGTSANNYIAAYQYAGIQKSNVIAPKFMLASGYGSCAGTKVDWVHNAERCASYQEDGYPAGRWRLPTEAEILFVYNLAEELNLISNPFYYQSSYWSNSGRRYNEGTFKAAGTGNYSSRCVYDLWYWGEEPALTGNAATQWSGFMTSK